MKYTVRIAGTNQYYGLKDKRPYWTTQADAREFRCLDLAKGLAQILSERGFGIVIEEVGTTVPSRTNDETTELFGRYRALAHSIANLIAKRAPHLKEDLVDEADSYLGILVSDPNAGYDSTRAAMSTWIYHSVYWQLMTVLRQRLQTATREGTSVTWDPPSPTSGLPRKLMFLSWRGRVVVEFLLSDRKKYTQKRYNIRDRECELRSLLARKLGWSPQEVEATQLELERAFA